MRDRSAPSDEVAKRQLRRVGSSRDEANRPDVALDAPQLVAYRVQAAARMPLQPAPVERAWLDATDDRFAYRCLPLLIANQAGWFILNSHALDAVWNGGDEPEDITVTYRSGDPPYPALSHFGHGILTWHIPYLFQTPPGIQLQARGPANYPKDGIVALEGIVETEWSPATFTMNWQMTRPRRRVSFEPGEPICMVVPVAVDLLERARPEIRAIHHEPELQQQYTTWSRSRAAFLAGLDKSEPEAVALGWQKDYFRGRTPDGRTVRTHRTKLKLQPFFDTEGITPAKPEPES